MTTMHLTDDQFSDLLAGDNAPQEAMLHLEHCAHCRAELEETRTSMESFNDLSLTWAQAEAPRRIHVPSRWDIRRRALPAWTLVTAMTVAIAAVGIHHEVTLRQADDQMMASTSLTDSSPSTSQLAEDNRLMMSINQELSYHSRASTPVVQIQSGRTNTLRQVAY